MLPAGEYYVGDLYYVMHQEWPDVYPHTKSYAPWELTLNDGRLISGVRVINTSRSYNTSLGHTFGVKSGIIGVIQTKDISELSKRCMMLGAVIMIGSDFDITLNHKTNNIHIGEHIITMSYSSDIYYDYSGEEDDE